MKPLISVITATFHRENLLARCVQSILAQQVDADFEHLVINDAGEPLVPAPWMEDPRVRILNTFRTERCVARNTGAALSQGEWLYFLDDDDYALPGAFDAMLAAARGSGAVIVYEGYQIHNERTGETDILQPSLPPDVSPILFAGEILPLQGTWLARDAFFAAGGFDPAVKASQDVDLYRRIAFTGKTVGTPHIGAMVRVEHQTTTTQWARQREFRHLGMEHCLRLPVTLPHLLAATLLAPYWRGRCAREYVAAALRLAADGHRLLALTRLSAAVRLSRGFLHKAAFGRGLRRLPPV